MFTARYGLIPYIEQITFRLLEVKGSKRSNTAVVPDFSFSLVIIYEKLVETLFLQRHCCFAC